MKVKVYTQQAVLLAGMPEVNDCISRQKNGNLQVNFELLHSQLWSQFGIQAKFLRSENALNITLIFLISSYTQPFLYSHANTLNLNFFLNQSQNYSENYTKNKCKKSCRKVILRDLPHAQIKGFEDT